MRRLSPGSFKGTEKSACLASMARWTPELPGDGPVEPEVAIGLSVALDLARGICDR